MILRNVIISAIAGGMLCLVATAGCSSAQGTAVTPDERDVIQSPDKDAQSGRMLWGVWQFSYDESIKELTAIPLREAYVHFNVAPMLLPPNCSDCVKTHVNSFDTISHMLDVNVTLHNPSALTGHDVRGILYTNAYGHELTNADDWTGLWDVAGGQTLNPFKAFAKSTSHRVFAPGADYTEQYLIHIPTPPQWNKITFAVDASWPGNCREAYSIENFTQEKLYDTGGGQALVTVDVRDWQNDVNKVTLAAPEITGESFTQLYKISGDTWGIYVKNNAGAPEGDYSSRIIAQDAALPNLSLHDFFTITISGSASSTGWARTWGDGASDEGYGVAVDGDGNVYTTGWFQGAVDFNPGTGVDSHTSNGLMDVFLSKYNSDGEFLWARTWGGGSDDGGYGISIDESGYLYITGSYSATVDFNPDVGSTSKTSNGLEDAFLSKLTPNGEFQWVRTWGGTGSDRGIGVAADGIGHIYVTGYFEDTVDFNPSIVSDWHTSAGLKDISISEFDPSDSFHWARTWGDSQDDWGKGVAADGSGNAYVTGFFKGSSDFDTGTGVDVHTSKGDADIFLRKFDPSADYQWGRTWGAAGNDEGSGVAVDTSGNAFTTGHFSETVDFDPGIGTDEHISSAYQDIFIDKLDTDGAFAWARTWGGSGTDEGRAVGVDEGGGAYVAGFFGSLVDFDPGPGIEMHTAVGDWDIFLSKFSAAGDYAWARTWGGSGDDRGRGIDVYKSSDVYLTGFFNGTADFDPGTGVDDHISNGDRDVFLSKFPPDGDW